MVEYDPQKIETKWQEKWEEDKVFQVKEDPAKPKFFVLEMYPYPSSALHMGHLRNYSIGDTFARYKRMQAFNVLYPMGYDSFGLPAENAAIDHGIDPESGSLTIGADKYGAIIQTITSGTSGFFLNSTKWA